MATLREGTRLARAVASRRAQYMPSTVIPRRWASSDAASSPAISDVETNSSFNTPGPDDAIIKSFDTAKRIADRQQQLPGKRFQYHPPKYDRGPLHPIQSPPSSDPTARNFVPGPFNLPRMKQTYDGMIASDLMTLAYLHKVPGTTDREPRERLREWDGSSPYHKNRPLRGPRGSPSLDLLEKNITFRNIPEIKSVSISAFQPGSNKNPALLATTRSVIQAITGITPTTIKAKHGVSQWKVKEGDRAGVKATIYGNQAIEFVDKLANIVLPKIKDWPGLKGSTGDDNGNLALGLRADDMAWFPEIAVNYDMYPARLIPGCRIFIHTTATSDRHARLLFQALGLPFHGRTDRY
ncbi:54S ribosomal protein L7 [Plectosphaerella cucumerina]|uniref:54S ribosomal protein L7 n=1 Tax=Plectosphaerella cucumerina TaxID=40658 RepID=A0A8K0TGQ1_9PEZI|nr:54S ribosomal protein L7 [Plectosphaerella cucumerina]